MADNFTMNDDNEQQPSATQPEAMTPQQVSQQSVFTAVEAHFIAQRARAIANINGYIHSPAGVAEHPDIVEEVIKLLSAIDDADGKLATLKRITQPS